MPSEWVEKRKLSGLIWSAGGDFRGLAWRDDPDTTSRSAQFANGFVGSVLGGWGHCGCWLQCTDWVCGDRPEYVPSAFCQGNRAPISATYNVSVEGMTVKAIAMDMINGAVEQVTPSVRPLAAYM